MNWKEHYNENTPIRNGESVSMTVENLVLAISYFFMAS